MATFRSIAFLIFTAYCMTSRTLAADQCTTDSDCANGGLCITHTSENHTCRCPWQFGGIKCEFECNCTVETEVCIQPSNEEDACASCTSCNAQTHVCVTENNRAVCTKKCTENSNCGAGGTCDTEETSSCKCGPTMTGQDCSIACPVLDPTCGNGTCIPSPHDATTSTCHCDAGFTGEVCDTRTCTANSCENGGTCANALCACTENYTGDLCQIKRCDSSADCSEGLICAQNLCLTDTSGSAKQLPSLGVLLLVLSRAWIFA